MPPVYYSPNETDKTEELSKTKVPMLTDRALLLGIPKEFAQIAESTLSKMKKQGAKYNDRKAYIDLVKLEVSRYQKIEINTVRDLSKFIIEKKLEKREIDSLKELGYGALEIIKNKKIKKEDVVKIQKMLPQQKEYPELFYTAIRDLETEPRYKWDHLLKIAEKVHQIQKIIFEKTDRAQREQIDKSRTLILYYKGNTPANPKSGLQMLDSIISYFKQEKSDIGVLDALRNYMSEDNFKPEIVTNFLKKLEAVANDLDKIKETSKNKDLFVAVVSTLLSRPAHMWGDVLQIGKKLAEIQNIVFQKIVENKKTEQVDGEILALYYKIISFDEYKNSSKMLDQIASYFKEKGSDTRTLYILKLYLNKDDFKPEIVTQDFLKKLQKIITDKTNSLLLLLVNNNFKIEDISGKNLDDVVATLDTVFDIEKTQSKDLSRYLRMILDSRNATPAMVKLLNFVARNYKSELARIIKIIEGIAPEERKNMALDTVQDAKTWMSDRGIRIDKIENVLNFTFAFSVLGKERTEKLYASLGIEYFGRYSQKTLQTLYANLENKETDTRPTLLVVFNKNDYNSAFYSAGKKLEELAKYYKLIITETDTEDGFYDAVNDVSKVFGKIDTMIIGGHGEPNSIQLGKNDEKGFLDLTDEEELVQLRSAFVKKPTVILIACSTGKGEKTIGATISKAWNGRSFAPNKDANIEDYKLKENGQIDSVKYYEAETGEYNYGIRKRAS